mmetsp:Transcript_6365/g.10074  ORF Transcript_6365/g.10074 Transcript_6365/m.10074 type:complete len:194 (-) Transcript_6365:51-632(-)
MKPKSDVDSKLEEKITEKQTDQNDNVKQDVRILFLDVDGVLNYSSMHYTKPLPLSEVHVKRIGKIVHTTQCKIAFSTSWRLRKNSREKLKDALNDIGGIDMASAFIGCTPPPNILNKSLMKRSIEIRDFLSKLTPKYNILQYAIVDDTDLLQECANDDELKKVIVGHFIIIDGSKGITDDDMHSVINCLNGSK